MRIRLKSGKQKKLIYLAKGKHTWKKLSEKLFVDKEYLSHDLKNERVLLSENIYQELCKLTGKNYGEEIIEKLKDNWGKAKGGKISSKFSKGSTIQIKIPNKNEKLAEVIGAILGDGNVNFYTKGKKVGVYQITIAGHRELDKDYHSVYLKNLFYELFKIEGKERIHPIKHSRFLVMSSKQLVQFFINEGELKSGDKIRNQVTIPGWIKNNEAYLRCCLRGLIDTDGSVFRMSRKDPNLTRINLTNHNETLLNDARNAFIKLGFHPSKTINNRQFYLSRQSEISKYLKEIGFSNKKHLDRVKIFYSPVR